MDAELPARSASPRPAATVAELFLENKPTIPGGLTKNDMMKGDPPVLSMRYYVADTPKPLTYNISTNIQEISHPDSQDSIIIT
jgi:hypothetical protein